MITLFRSLVLVGILALSGLTQLCAQTPEPGPREPVTVRVWPDAPVRQIGRHFYGHNFPAADKAMGFWSRDSLQPREPIYSRLRETKPGLLRFPGGRWSVGYQFDRARQHFPHRISNVDDVDTSFGPYEFLVLCENLGALPIITLDHVFSTPEETAAFVAYIVGEVADERAIGTDEHGAYWHTVGYWASLRAADGHPEPFELGYVEYGNGAWGTERPVRDEYDRTGSIGMAVADYIDRYVAAASAINSLFPEVRVGPEAWRVPDGQGQVDASIPGNTLQWNRELFSRIPPQLISFATLQFYYVNKGWPAIEQDYANLLAANEYNEERIQGIVDIMQQEAAATFPVIITQFNAVTGSYQKAPSLLNALHAIDTVANSLYNPHVAGTVRWTTVQHAWKNPTGLGLYVTRNSRPDIWKMAHHHAYKLLSDYFGTILLDREVIGSPEWMTTARSDYFENRYVPFVYAAASLSEDENNLYILILNKNTQEAYNVALEVMDGFVPHSEYTKVIFDAGPDGDILSSNAFGSGVPPEQDEIVRLHVHDNQPGATNSFTVTAERHSATVVKLTDLTLRLSWDSNSASEMVTGYDVYLGAAAATAVKIAELDTLSPSFDPEAPAVEFGAGRDLGLRSGDLACFRLRARNQFGASALSQPACVEL